MRKSIITALLLLPLVAASPAAGEDFAGHPPLTAEERVELYQQEAPQRLAQAQKMAEEGRNGTLDYVSAKHIRSALQEDMETWRDVFAIGSQHWEAMRHEWLVEQKLSAEEWAERRVAWFAARDSWMAAHRSSQLALLQ